MKLNCLQQRFQIRGSLKVSRYVCVLVRFLSYAILIYVSLTSVHLSTKFRGANLMLNVALCLILSVEIAPFNKKDL